MLCLYDSIDFPACFLGAIKAGVVPVPINTMWSAADYAFVLQDSRAKAVVVSEARLPVMEEAAQISGWKGTMVVAGTSDHRYPQLAALWPLHPQVAKRIQRGRTMRASGSTLPDRREGRRARCTCRPACYRQRNSSGKACRNHRRRRHVFCSEVIFRVRTR